CLAKLTQLADDANRKLRRDREANADRATGGRDDRRIDADDLAVHVEQRATRITAVDRGVSLDEVVIRAGINVAAARRDNADRNRAAKAERIADRHDPVADANLRRITEFHLLQLAQGWIDLEDRKVRLWVCAHKLGLQLAAIGEVDFDLVRVGDDVVVGDDDAFLGIDDEAGTERLNLAAAAVVVAAFIEEVVKEFLEW